MRVLITGAARRVGRAIATEFAAAGHQVVIHYRSSQTEAKALFTSLGGQAAGHALVQADLDDATELQALIPGLIDRQLTPDCLINNAGTFPRQPLREATLDSLASTFHTNCLAPFVLMRDHANHVAHGSIINLLDQRVETVNPDVGAYAIAKKALRDFTLAAALDWAPHIRVNAVAPGLTIKPDDMPEAIRDAQLAQVPMGRDTAPQEIASACRFLAEAETITGQILFLDGGLHLTLIGDQ